jgi:hypothetical protein
MPQTSHIHTSTRTPTLLLRHTKSSMRTHIVLIYDITICVSSYYTSVLPPMSNIRGFPATTHTHTHTHTHTQTQIHTQTHTHTHTVPTFCVNLEHLFIYLFLCSFSYQRLAANVTQRGYIFCQPAAHLDQHTHTHIHVYTYIQYIYIHTYMRP